MRLVHAHAEQFPAGALSDAVVALHVQLLCSLGQTEKAQAEAAQLRAARPGSPVARRLRGGCPAENKETPGSVNHAPDGHGE